MLTPTSENDQSRIRPFSGRLSYQDALHVESDLDSSTISSINQRPYCFLDAEFLELVSVANNPGLRRMIGGLRVFDCKPLQLAFTNTTANPSIIEVVKLSFTIILGFFFGSQTSHKK